MTTANRVRAIATLPVLALVVVACAYLPGGAETSTMVIVNKTTVPVSAEDSGSRRIVGPCSERTIEYHGTWGGDPASSTPYAEPKPSDAFSISLESQFTRPFENPIHQRILVDTTGRRRLDRIATCEPDRAWASLPGQAVSDVAP